MKSRNRDVASAGHHRERLKSSPRPARGKFPSGDVPPRGRPSVLPGAQGGASGWGLRVGPLGGLRGPARAQSPLGSPPRVFSGSICAARFSFDTAPKFSCAPRSEKSEVPPEPPRGPRAGGPEPFPPPRGGTGGGNGSPVPCTPRRGGGSPRAEGASCGKDSFSPPAPPSDEPAGGREMLSSPARRRRRRAVARGARPASSSAARAGAGGRRLSPRGRRRAARAGARVRARQPAVRGGGGLTPRRGGAPPGGLPPRGRGGVWSGAAAAAAGPGRAGPEPALPWEGALPASVVRGRGR